MYERFKKLLEERQITTYVVSKATGISSSTFTEWKKGTYTPKQDKLKKIADYFDVTVDYLMGRTDYPNLEVFQKEPNEIITYQKGQKKEAAPITEQLPDDRRQLIMDILDLNDDDFQTAKDVYAAMFRKKSDSNS